MVGQRVHQALLKLHPSKSGYFRTRRQPDLLVVIGPHDLLQQHRAISSTVATLPSASYECQRSSLKFRHIQRRPQGSDTTRRSVRIKSGRRSLDLPLNLIGRASAIASRSSRISGLSNCFAINTSISVSRNSIVRQRIPFFFQLPVQFHALRCRRTNGNFRNCVHN